MEWILAPTEYDHKSGIHAIHKTILGFVPIGTHYVAQLLMVTIPSSWSKAYIIITRLYIWIQAKGVAPVRTKLQVVRLSRWPICSLELQPPLLVFARQVAATYRISQQSWRLPQQFHQRWRKTKDARTQSCSTAADAKSVLKDVTRLSERARITMNHNQMYPATQESQSASPITQIHSFSVLYCSITDLAQRSSPAGSLVHVHRFTTLIQVVREWEALPMSKMFGHSWGSQIIVTVFFLAMRALRPYWPYLRKHMSFGIGFPNSTRDLNHWRLPHALSHSQSNRGQAQALCLLQGILKKI